MADLLIELLSEEIPARMQARAIADLERLVRQGFDQADITYTETVGHVTPRRLVLAVSGLKLQQPDRVIERKGPRVGSPTNAIQGFLNAAGLTSLNQAVVRHTEKGDFFFALSQQPGRQTIELLPSLLNAAITALPWPKSMRWSETSFRWVRPLHNILAVFDGQLVPCRIEDTPSPGETLVAKAETCGHRFLAPDWFPVKDFAGYKADLEKARVMVDQARRRTLILERATQLATDWGSTLKDDPALLDEVTGLVEWPVVLVGRIDAAFMDLPEEVLTTAMRAHQKYFAMLTNTQKLAPRFIVVANTETADDGRAVVAGNERVLRARLSDAKFFWDEDRKKPLADRYFKLDERVFHAKLGSDWSRTNRLKWLAEAIAGPVGAVPERAAQAAYLCKADLTSLMVGEFPELQGVMGRYYAQHDGEPAEVAEAIADHYAPQGPADRCPTAPVSVAVALADKIDTLVGFFAIGEKPTGSGDPFALRRAALGVIRLITENGLRLGLRQVFAASLDQYLEELGSNEASLALMRSVDRNALFNELLSFFADRLKVHLKGSGVRHDLIAAVFAGGAEDDLVKLLARVEALRDFLNTDDGANLLTAYRRASNIVRIEEKKDSATYAGEVVSELLSAMEETMLHRSLTEARDRISVALTGERFGEAMTVLAELRGPVDDFFENVTVNCSDVHLRANRLNLLAQIRSALGGVADFSQIEG